MTSTLLHNLNSLAVIPPNTNWSYRSWLNLGLQCLKRGLDFEKANDIKGAYVEYLKLTSLVLEVLPSKSINTTFNLTDEEVYMKLKKAVTEKLPLIEKWKQLFKKSSSSSKTMSNSTNTSNTTNNVANKPPTKPLPAIPVKQPVSSANGAANTQSTITNNGTAPIYNTNNPIPNPQMHKTPTGVTYTTPSSFQLPENENITKLELGRLWSQSKGGASNPSILFIDLRPKDLFEQSTIKGSNIVNIDLTAVKPHISARELEMYLSSRNLKMGHLFSSRHTFDCIVMYDQDSEYIQASSMLNGQVSQCTIYDIKLAITEHEYSKKLRKAPYFLIGGLKEWYSYLGDKGLIHYTQNKFPAISITSSSSSSVKSSSQLSATGAIGPARGKPIYQNVSDYLSGQASAIKAQESMMKPRSPQPARLRSPIFEPIPISTTSSNQSSERRRTIFDDHYYNFTGSPPVPEPAKLSHISPPMTPTQSTSQSSYFTTTTPPLTPMPVSSAPSSHIGATGLRNLGNTCFMNSIIQCINGTSPLARHFLDGSYRKQINTVNYMGYKGALAEEFASLIRSLWNNQSSAISPSSFRVLVGSLSSQFKNYDQQDSQEFLAFLLDGLHEDLNLVINRPTLPDIDDDYFESLPDQQASDLAWDRYTQLNNSIIVNLFQGQLRSRLQCQACFKTSTSYNTFMYLSLPIPKLGKFHKSVPLIDCLNSFVKEEVLDGDDAWICSRCKVPRKTIKQLSISRLPDILLIHLKRFSYEGPFRNKLDTMVDCPLTKLDLTKYVPPTSAKSSITDPNGKPLGHVYNLYAVSNHYGTLNGGHYTASVRNGYNGEWRYFDDSQISLINEKKVVTSAAYNLFYVRTNVNG